MEPLTRLVGLLRSLGVNSYQGPNPFQPESGALSLTLGPEPQKPGPALEPAQEPDTEAMRFAAAGAMPLSLDEMVKQLGE